jgi:hypothetical protein
MKRAIQFLARLYPRSWRNRYGDEFDALLGDFPVGWGTLLDVISQGIKLHGATPFFWACSAALSMLGFIAGIAISERLPHQWIVRRQVTLMPGQSVTPNYRIEVATPSLMQKVQGPSEHTLVEFHFQDRAAAGRFMKGPPYRGRLVSSWTILPTASDPRIFMNVQVENQLIHNGPNRYVFAVIGSVFGFFSAISITGLRRALA